MGLERLQAGEEGGDSGCAALWRGAYIFHKTPPKTPRAQHIVLCTGVSKKWLSATFSSFLIFYRPSSQRQTGISPRLGKHHHRVIHHYACSCGNSIPAVRVGLHHLAVLRYDHIAAARKPEGEQTAAQPGELKNHSLDGFFPATGGPFPSHPSFFYAARKRDRKCDLFFVAVNKKGRDSKSVIGIGLLALRAAQSGLTRFPGR